MSKYYPIPYYHVATSYFWFLVTSQHINTPYHALLLLLLGKSALFYLRAMTWIAVRCHPQKQHFLRYVPTCPFNVHREQGCSLVPLGTSSVESPVAEGRAANHTVSGKEAVNLWKRFKSREKTGGIELHLKNGEREPICVEMMSPFPMVLACSAKISHPLVQKHSLKQRLLSGGMAKKKTRPSHLDLPRWLERDCTS